MPLVIKSKAFLELVGCDGCVEPAMAVARLLREGPVWRVVIANAAEVRAISHARAVVMRCLLGRPPASDLFGRKGRA